MRFLLNVIDDRTGSGTPEERAEIDAFNDRLEAGGHWVLAAGVGAPDRSRVIDGRGPAPVVTDGPLAVSREYVSGFWVIEAADGDEALALAIEASRCCNRRVELRPFL